MRSDDRKDEHEEKDEPLSMWDIFTFTWLFSALFDW